MMCLRRCSGIAWGGVWCAGFRGDCFRSAGVEVGQDLVDALARDPESFGDFGSWFTLVSYGFNNCEVAVGAVHLSTMSRLIPRLPSRHAVVGESVNDVAAEVSTFTPGSFPWLSVNHVAADLSTIRKVLPVTLCQLCRDFGHSLGRFWGSRRIWCDCSNNPLKTSKTPLPAQIGEAFLLCRDRFRAVVTKKWPKIATR